MIKWLVALAIGGGLGAWLGARGQCETGACPLTSNPWIGGLFGTVIVALAIGALPAGCGKSNSGEAEMNSATHSARIVNLGSEAAWDSTVLQSPAPVLVDLWAAWCGPCRTQAPILDELAEEIGDAARIVKVNVDDLPGIAKNLGVRGIPTLIVFRNGQEAERMVGVQDKAALRKALGL